MGLGVVGGAASSLVGLSSGASACHGGLTVWDMELEFGV